MSYIIKNTSGLVNTRVTDIGRQKLSQGNFKISYFQVGDSEISYDKLGTTYNQTNSFVLEPQFNSQNATGVPQSNRQYVKYPYLTDSTQTNTYGIPFMDSIVEPVFNRAPLRGFFGGVTTGSSVNWNVLTNTKYVVSANYVIDMATLVGTNKVKLIYDQCDLYNINEPSVGDIITIYYDGNGLKNCGCNYPPQPTPTPTPTPTPSTTPQPILETCIIMTELDEFMLTEDDFFLVWDDCDTTPVVSPTSASTVYTVPSSTTTLITNIVVRNSDTTARTYSIFLNNVGLAVESIVPARESVIIDAKQVMVATTTLRLVASNAAVSFHVTGLEITP